MLHFLNLWWLATPSRHCPTGEKLLMTVWRETSKLYHKVVVGDKPEIGYCARYLLSLRHLSN